MSKRFILIIVITNLLAIGVGVYGGMKYNQSKSLAGRGGNFANLTPEQRQARFGVGGGGVPRVSGGGLVNGDIISKDAASLTIKLRDGGSKIIFYSDTTTVGKTVDGALSDLEVGKQAIVTGTTNSDGSITAQAIQLRPAMLPSQQK